MGQVKPQPGEYPDTFNWQSWKSLIFLKTPGSKLLRGDGRSGSTASEATGEDTQTGGIVEISSGAAESGGVVKNTSNLREVFLKKASISAHVPTNII